MEYKTKRTPKAIDDLLNQCAEAEDRGKTKYPGMTYEQGIRYALEWLFDEEMGHPLED